MLITFFEHMGKTKREKSSFFPSVAVIVPCWNEETTVSGTIKSLLELDYPKDKLQIIAVDDGSTDNTLNILNTFKSQVTVISKENGGKHSAMNEALLHTDAEFVGCLDADSYVEKSALTELIRHFEDEDVAAVTPSIKIHNANSLLQIVQKAEYGLAIFVRKAFSLMGALFITPGPFSFFRRSVIEEIGPWRHAHGVEDLEMCLRLQMNHKRVENEPDAIVHTTAPRNLHQLYTQRVRWTYGFLKNVSIYRKMFFNPKYGTLGMFILPISFLSIFSALTLFSVVIWNTAIMVVREFVRFQSIGIQAPSANFDLYFIPTSSVLIITIILISLTFVLMGIGKKMAKDSIVSLDMPVYLLIYGFITPLWLGASLFKVIVGKSAKWR